MEEFRRGAKLRQMAAFSRPIYDDEAILFDIALYHSVFNLGLTFRAAVERARAASETLNVRGDVGKGQAREGLRVII